MTRPKRLKKVHDGATFASLAQWEELYGYCIECERRTRLDKYKLGQRFGLNTRINALRLGLTCQNIECKNKKGNMFGTTSMDR